MKGRNTETVRAIVMALGGVLVLAGALRLVAWGYASAAGHLQRAAEVRTLSRALYPSPVRTPTGVTRTLLNALQHHDSPVKDAGLATLYNFMEPVNRSNLGSFTDFAADMEGSVYTDLFGDAAFSYGRLQMEGRLATQTIEVKPLQGQRAVYVVSLALQDEGIYAGCWMIRNMVHYPQLQPQPPSP